MPAPRQPVILIPARLASTRLPDKPLADIAGEPMIVHVWRRSTEAALGRVVVAAAEQAIVEAVTAAGGESVLTDPDLPSGSDRIHAALTAIELSTDMMFVTTTDVPAIVAVRRQIEILDQVGYTSQRRILVLNRSNAKVGLSVKDVEETIGMEVKFEIPSTRVVPVSTYRNRSSTT